MKKFYFFIVFFIITNLAGSQTISGKLENSKDFKFTDKYWSVDGFGCKKMIGIEYTKNGIISTYKFKSQSYESWFSIEETETYLNVRQSNCAGCKPKKFVVKKLNVRWK